MNLRPWGRSGQLTSGRPFPAERFGPNRSRSGASVTLMPPKRRQGLDKYGKYSKHNNTISCSSSMPIQIDLPRGFRRFAELLNTRLKSEIFTTEDSVRYSFFAALHEQGVQPHEVVLEYRHPVIHRAQVDTWIPDLDPDGLAVEFKYDRPIPSDRNQPRPQKAGMVLKDLFRLARFPAPARRLFIHLTSSEMSDYLGREKNRLTGFFNLEIGEGLVIDQDMLSACCNTLQRAAGPPVPCLVHKRFQSALPNQNLLQVWQVAAPIEAVEVCAAA